MKTKPVYLIPGGPASEGRQLTEDCRAALQACGKRGPTVAYVGTASQDDESFFHFMEKPLLDAGAENVFLTPIAGGHEDIAMARRMLNKADAIFLSGGEVDDGMAGLANAGLDAFMTELYREGKFFFGLSAGSIMMGQRSARWDVEGDDSTATLFPCLNFVPMIFDAHGEDEGWAELKCVLRLLGDGARGFGLSTGGLYMADRQGQLTSFRNGPAVFRNVGGMVQREEKLFHNSASSPYTSSSGSNG